MGTQVMELSARMSMNVNLVIITALVRCYATTPLGLIYVRVRQDIGITACPVRLSMTACRAYSAVMSMQCAEVRMVRLSVNANQAFLGRVRCALIWMNVFWERTTAGKVLIVWMNPDPGGVCAGTYLLRTATPAAVSKSMYCAGRNFCRKLNFVAVVYLKTVEKNFHTKVSSTWFAGLSIVYSCYY